jgi:RNA polymerase sigma factor for flagellar operon FliA
MASNDNVRLDPEVGSRGNATTAAEENAHARALLLFEGALDLVDIVAGRLARTLGSFVEREELIAAGREGLFDAARRFDESRGVPFRAYAAIRIEGAIMDAVRQSSRLPRRAHERLRSMAAMAELSEGMASFVFATPKDTGAADVEDQFLEHMAALAVSCGATVAIPAGGGQTDTSSSDAPSPEEAVLRAEARERLRAAMTQLEIDEADLVQLYYFEGHSIRETAKRLGVSKSWAHRLHTRALARLSNYLLTPD